MASIYVFGSNLAGRHGAGSARVAMRLHGARWGVGEGPTGQAYALPTKDSVMRTLPLAVITQHVATFLLYAQRCPMHTFYVVEVGCGLAGYTPAQIAPMFAAAPANVRLPTRFLQCLTS